MRPLTLPVRLAVATKMDAVFLLWLILILGCFLVILIYVFRSYLPDFLSDLFKWGKTKIARNGVQAFLEVPNSWFTHFYLMGILWTLVLACFLVITCNIGTRKIQTFIHFLVSPNFMTSPIPCASVVLSLVLLLFQVSRRFMECLFVSVFTGKIHVAHYVVGMVFYLLAGLSLSAPLLPKSALQGWCYSCSNNFVWDLFQLPHCIGCMIFFWSSWHQYKCHVILAELRTSKKLSSHVRVHNIPHGDWFEYISSPHYFAEILIYTSFTILHRGCNAYTWLMFIFVVLNLSLGASVTQQWYQEKFKDYPKSRCRIFPFLY